MIDIIIPAYNAHDTIKKTLLSICIQNIKDIINVYIIDDCSNSDYNYLLDEFKNELNIFIYRNKKNLGPGASRNKGLELSNSEYIMFIDSDDLLVNPFSLSSLYNNIGDKDIAIGILEIEQENGSIEFISNHDRCLHAKLYKKKFLDKYNIRFTNTNRHEDSSFHELCLFAKPKIKFVDEYVYFYSYNDKSLTHEKDGYEEFKNYKLYIDNTLWAAKEGEKRNFDMETIISTVDSSLIYLYFCYQDYIKYDYAKEIFIWLNPLVNFYLKNMKYLKEDTTLKNYIGIQNKFNIIPAITWYQFLESVNKN